MIAFRGLGWLLLAFAVAVLVHDLLGWWSEGRFPLSTLGTLWTLLDPASLGDAHLAVRRRTGGALWNWTMQPLLMVPAAPALAVLGVFFLWLGHREGGRPEPGLIGGSRPRRRRRGLS